MTHQICIIARHGIRADTESEIWEDYDTRPWDPPLANKGWKDAWARFETLTDKINAPDMIFSSPYTRCVQTASILLKIFGMPYSKLIIDKGLSESYDYINTVRYVDSDDIVDKVTNKYMNMAKWFYKCREENFNAPSMQRKYILKPFHDIQSLFKKYVLSFWKDSTKSQIKEQGEFPDFETYLPIFRKGMINRFQDAFDRCIQKMTVKKHKVIAIVTHKAGVEVIFENLFGRLAGDCPTAGYFVIYREHPNQNFQLAFKQM